MKVFILNGGKGTRLGLTNCPKPMVELAGKPLLLRLVEAAKRSGFDDFVFLNGHLAEVIEEFFGDGSAHGVSIRHVREQEPLGTAGAFLNARELIEEPFMVLYGDVLLDVDLDHMAAFHRAKGGLGTLFVHPNDHPFDSDLLEADECARIVSFHSKPREPDLILPNLVSAALYVLDPDAIRFLPKGKSDWGRDIFPKIVAAGERLNAYRSLEYVKDMGTPDRLAMGERDLHSGKVARMSRRAPKPAVFLDRDGVLNMEINGVHRAEALELIPGVGEAVRRLNRAGLPAICITNQPDVAKGFMNLADLRAVHASLDVRLAEHGAYLDDLYFCPHHPERGFQGEVPELKVECDCRKPRPGMLRRAAADHRLDLTNSWFIGDRFADVAASHAAGARAMLVRTGHSGADAPHYDLTPEFLADDLAQAVSHILAHGA